MAAGLLALPVWAATPCATLVKTATDFGYVETTGADVTAATVEGMATVAAARAVLGIPKLRLAIVERGCTDVGWSTQDAAGHLVYPWSFANGPRKGSAKPADDVLRHEIGHDLFVRYVVPRTRQDEYGSDAPDWLDEMAAVAFESADEQRDRRLSARMDADTTGLIPLPRLMDMVHPEYGHLASTGDAGTFQSKPPDTGLTIVYYSTIKALYDFLVLRTGRRDIVAEMARAARQGDDLREWIPRQLGLRGVEASMARVDRDFRTWFEADPRYRVSPAVRMAPQSQVLPRATVASARAGPRRIIRSQSE